MNIKPIETRYAGYRFRSRLEARWAVFFDALGLDWVYEQQGFDLGADGRYLPDFWLPQVDCYAEVKPQFLAKPEFNKCLSLAMGTGRDVILLDAPAPENRPYFAIVAGAQDRDHFGIYQEFCANLPGSAWGLTPAICLTMYHDYPRSERRFYCSPGGPEDGIWDDTGYAVEYARSARFEHGERG